MNQLIPEVTAVLAPANARLRRLAPALLLAAAALTAIAPGAETAEPTVDALMIRLLHPDAVTREAALGTITRRGERAAIPGLIDLLPFDVFLDSSLAGALERLSGQTFGHDWRRWVEWLAARPDVRPHREYAAWKSGLFGRIDPKFTEFIHPGVNAGPASRRSSGAACARTVFRR